MSILTSPEERDRRLNICKSCELYKGDADFLWGVIEMKDSPQCAECSCFINNLIKFTDIKCSHPNGNKWELKKS